MNGSAGSQRLEFPGSQGGPLAARLDLPVGAPRAFALFAHCFSCSKDVLAASRIARALTESGIAVLRFDFTGLGQSEGDFSNTNFSSNILDLVNVADYLREHYRAPSILIGHSLGGAAVLAAAHRIPETRAVVTIGAPAEPQHVAKLLRDDVDTIRKQGFADVDLGGRTFRIHEQFLTDIDQQPQAERIRTLGAALLVMHSPVDQTVSVSNARKIFDLAQHPKSFVALDGADHLLTSREDSQFAADIIGVWAGRYAFEADAAAGAPLAAATVAAASVTEREPGVVTVTETGNGTFQQLVTSGGHALLADEPDPVGTDTGLSPYEFLLAGLGACTSMTLRMYAERKGIALKNVSVRLSHSRIHAMDCANCETAAGQIDHIDRRITLTGGLSDDERKRLLAIADNVLCIERCLRKFTSSRRWWITMSTRADQPVSEKSPMATRPRRSAPAWGQAVGAALIIAVIWVVLALTNPTTTYHLSPVLASDFTAVQGDALDETVIALLIGTVVGVLISTVRIPGLTNTSAAQKSQRVDADR